MKFQRIAQAALLALLATACSGDASEDASNDTPAPAEVVTETTVAAIAPTTTVELTTTTLTEAPPSLAFASSQDIGRLFTVSGFQNIYNSAGGDQSGTVEDGQLVQATSARTVDGQLWVNVRDTSAEPVPLGWLPADQLAPTTQSVIFSNEANSGELRIARRSRDPIPVVSNPGGTSQAFTLAPEQVAVHGGSEALAASGETYLDIIDLSTGSRLGWVQADQFDEIRSNKVQNSLHEPIRTRVDKSVTYGARLPIAQITVVGCNATQVVFSNPSLTQGLAFVLGQGVPEGQQVGSSERWAALVGGTVFAAPGEDVTLTLTTNQPRTWYFAELDQDLRAQAPRNPDGSLVILDGATTAQATDVQTVELAGGSCAYVAPVTAPNEPSSYGDESIGFNELGVAEEAVDEDVEAEDSDGVDEELSDESEDTADGTDTTTTTTVAQTTTTAAPTTTTVAPTTTIAPTTVAPTTTTTTTTTVAPTTTTTAATE